MKPKSTAFRRLPSGISLHCSALSIAAMLVIASGPSATAASLSWDGANTATAGAQGGAGTWNAAGAANWWDGSADVTWPDTGTNNDAVFGGTAGTVAIGAGGVAVNDITFTTTGYVVSGANTITLNGTTPTISLASGLSATLGNNTALLLAGSSGLTLGGGGSVIFNPSTASTLTGGITVTGGASLTLTHSNLATPTNVVPTGNSVTLRGGNLVVSGKASATASQTFSGVSTYTGNSSISVNNTGTSTTAALGTITQGEVGGVVSIQTPGGAALTTSGAIATTTGAVNSYIGPWVVNGNSKSANARWAYVNASSQIVVITGTTATAGTLANLTSDTTVYTYSGTSTLDGNRTAYAIQDNGGTATSTTLGGFTLTTNGISSLNAAAGRSFIGATGSGGIVVGSANELVLMGAAPTTLSVPVMNGTAGNSNVTYAGGSTLLLDTAASTYSGQTTVNSGTLRIGTGGSINASSGIKVNGGTFLQTNTAAAVSPVVTLQGGTVDGTGTINTVNVSNLAANVVTNGNGGGSALTINALTFNGSATASVRPSAGGAGILVTGALATTPANGKVVLNVPVSQTWTNGSTYNLISYGSYSGSASDFTVGTIAGLGARQVAAVGTTGATNGFVTLQITGDNAIWTGGVSANWTTTAVGSPYNWALQNSGTGTEYLAADNVVFDDSATGPTTVVISDANVAPASTTFNNSAKTYTITSASGFGITAGALVKNGSGTAILTTTNTYAGGTTINAGTLQVGGGAAIVDTGLVTLANAAGATFQVASSESIGALAGGGATGGTVGINAGQTLTLTSGTQTYSGAISGSGALVQAGGSQTLAGGISISGGIAVNSGVLTLSGASNSYLGTTTIAQGSGILVSANGALGGIGGGNGTTIASTTGSSSGVLGFSGGVNYTAAEKITGSGIGNTSTIAAFPAVQRGFIQAVTGSNTFAGAIEINATGLSRIGTQNGAQLTLTGAITMASGVTGVQPLFRSGDTDGDYVTLGSSSNSWDTDTSVYSGNNTAGQYAGLRLGVSNALPAGQSILGYNSAQAATSFDMAGFDQTLNGLVGGGSQLKIVNRVPSTLSTLTLATQVDRTNTTTSIADAGGQVAVVKSGSFSQRLGATNNYSGTTTIQGGTLFFTRAASLYNGVSSSWTASNITVGSGAALGLYLGGIGELTAANVGTILTNLTSGISNNGLKAGSTVHLFVDAVSTLPVALTDSTGTGGGSVGFIKNGPNTLTLNQADTFTGDTQLVAGGMTLAHTDALLNTPSITLTTGTTLTTSAISWTLGAAQSLKGTGTVSGSTTLAGTVSPGTSDAPIGTLALGASGGAGTTTLTGTYACDVNAGTNDKLTVTGGLNLTGASLVVNATAPAGSYTIATYTGALTGTFANVTLPFGFTVDYGTTGQIRIVYSASPFDTWMSGYPSITDPAMKLPTADPDGDGVSNQTEFAFGLAPDNGASANPILAQLDKTAGTFTYQRRKPSLSGFTSFRVWVSDNLVNWVEDTTAVQVPTDIPSSDNQSVKVTLSGAPLTAPKLFIRVSAE